MAGDVGVGRTQWGFIVCRLSAVRSCSQHGINNRAAQWALLKCSHYKQSTNNRPAATFSPNYISGPGGRGDSPIFSPCVILWHYICVTIERDFGCSMSIIAFFCRMGFHLFDIVQALKGLGLPDWRASDFWDSGFSDPVGCKHSHRLPSATTKGEDWALLSTWNLPHWQQSGFLKRIYWPQPMTSKAIFLT